MIAHLLQPLGLDVFETLAASDVEDKEDATGVAVEAARDGAEALLACCIPDLQLDIRLLFDDHAEVSELDTDRYTVLLCKGLISQSLQDTCLADASVSKDYNFEQYVKLDHASLEISIILYRDARWQIVDLRV